MRQATQLFLYSLLAVTLVNSAVAEEEKPPRIQAKEPTVVTVKGAQSEVALDQEQRSKAKSNPLKKAVHGIGHGLAVAGSGIVNGIGALLDVEDDIPSERERTQQQQQRKP
jgi:hypothetical protein